MSPGQVPGESGRIREKLCILPNSPGLSCFVVGFAALGEALQHFCLTNNFTK